MGIFEQDVIDGHTFRNGEDTMVFCPELEEMYQARTLVGRTGKTFQSAALSTPNNLLALKSLMLKERPENTLEIGLAFGGSCLALAAAHRALGRNGVCHVSVDPYQDTVWDGVARIYLDRAKLSSGVQILCEPSSIALPKLLSEGREFGLIYVDGSHLFEDVFVDVYFAWKLLRSGGIVLLDDSTDPHIQKVIKFVKRNLAESLQLIEIPGVSFARRIAQALSGQRQLTAFRKVNVAERQWDTGFGDF
jgi:predicted O-methyltransferase YrrM